MHAHREAALGRPGECPVWFVSLLHPYVTKTQRPRCGHGLGLIVALTLLYPVLGGGLSAQGILFVRVSGKQGPIAHATVEVLQRDTVWRRADTDQHGAARFAAVLPGTYQVRVRAYGYRPYLEKHVSVTGASSTVLDVQMEAVPVALEGLTVTSSRVEIQHETTEFNTQVTKKAIALLPVVHDARDLVALVPGARPGYVWGGANFQANNYELDGVSNNNPGMGGDLIKPNINWIDHVEVRGLGAGAEEGGFQGGLINVVTKRGTNDFHAMVRSSLENKALNASNLISTETNSEVTARREMEGEAQGPILRDRLFYYVSAKDTRQSSRTLNHLTEVPGTYTSPLEDERQDKLFGKLTWTPGPATQVDVSTAYLGTTTDNYDETGYQAPGAGHRYTAPTWLFSGSWRQTLGASGVLQVKVNHFSLDERQDSYGGEAMPGVRIFALVPPYTSFQNAPFTLRSAPSSTSADVSTSFRMRTGSLTQLLQVGVQYTYGSFLNQRIRNGGMTWFPAAVNGFDPGDPSTWVDPTGGWTATEWGGEVHLNADVANAAAYAQSAISLGSRVVLSPGVRWGRWQGWIDPASGSRFEAVHDQAIDPRVGLTVNLTSDGTWAAKAHWGRYHQDMMTQMFDRAAGSDAFTNQEVWYYRGPPVSDPTTTFTVAQRDSLAALGLFTQEAVEPLNQTGTVENYHQPYTDEWLVGIEKQFGHTAKLSLVYTRRTNHDMVALLDRNIAADYTYFPQVWAGTSGTPGLVDPNRQGFRFPGTNGIPLGGVWIPNNVLLQRLRCRAEGTCPNLVDVPGLTYADTANLTWNPQYVVTNAPGARRVFDQLQLVLNVSKPTWGGSFSAVYTGLDGNLDNVTGYTDPSTFDAGPYVNPNEAANDYGHLPNYADLEAKVSVWGDLPLKMQGGLFWTFRGGDYYSSTFRLTSLGIYNYDVVTLQGEPEYPGGPPIEREVAEPLDYRLLAALEGQNMFIMARGRYKMPAQANVDAHLERLFPVEGRHILVSLDVFNLLNAGTPTEIQSMLNYGSNPWGYGLANIANNAYFGYALQRMPPRTFRLSAEVRF